MADSKHPLYLIDAYGLIYRFYFALFRRPLLNAANRNISALSGFARTIVNLLNDGALSADAAGKGGIMIKPLRLAAVFDSRISTFRHKMYSEYKANRQKAPDDLHEQVPLVEEFLTSMGIPVLRSDGYEADDIIATLAEKCRAEKRQCYIISSDKDLLQLVGDGIWELRPAKNTNTENSGQYLELVGPEEVKAEWGVTPDKILDLLSLTGDTSDNIPGVQGIGEKTAGKLMARYGCLDEIYKNIAGITGAEGRKLAAGKESAYFSKSLIRLDANVPLPFTSIEELSIERLDRAAGAKVLIREGVRFWAKQLQSDAGSGSRQDNKENNAAAGDAKKHDGNEEDSAATQESYLLTTDKALLGSGTYRPINDLAELKSILEQAKAQKLLAIDFETDSLDAWNSRPIGVSLALRPKEAWYVPLAPSGPEADSPFLEPEKVRALLAPLFADSEMTIAAHNAKFDYKVSRGWGIGRWKCKIWDTMVAAWLADPERNNYSLDSLASYIFNVTPIAYKDIVPKGATFQAVPPETACRYSAEDSDLCMRMKQYLESRLNETGAARLFTELEMPLLPILAEMEGAGIKIESGVLKKYAAELLVELEQIQNDTYRIVGHSFNLASTKQLQEVLFTERKLKPGKKTKTGFSTDADALEELAREDPVPALILRHRTLAKLKSTYVDTLAAQADSEGRLHTNFVQTGTATGRLSSREPNLQNIPIRDEEGRRIREAFIAAPGCVLISADYSQIELVVLAHLSQDKNLISAFKEGVDVHARTAALIFGVDEKNVQNDQRRIAKTINFGVMYGMSAFRLANELNISRVQASGFIEAYFKTYSGVSAFIARLIKQTEETGYATTILGRRRFIRSINSRNKTEKAAAERVAVNTPIQGSAADIVKTAMLNLDARLAAEKSPARLLLQVHDELILECPREAAQAAAALVKDEMEKAVPLSIPLRVSVEIGSRWGAFH